jgi:hypothetical protein
MGRKGWRVTFPGMGLNLALGVLYSWSVFGKQFTEAVDKGGFGWSKTNAALPYTISASLMIFAAILTFFTKVPERETVGEVSQPVLAQN